MVSRSVTQLCSAKTAEANKMPFTLRTQLGPRNHVLDIAERFKPNSLARTVMKSPKFCHITPILRSLHWLRITERIEYKLLSLTYKVLTTTQHPYLHNLFFVQRPCSTLFIRRHSCSTTFIILSKNKWSLLPLCFNLHLESASLSVVNLILAPAPSISYSPIPSPITSSSSDLPLCWSITPSLSHFRLKTYLFHKS